MKVFLLVWVNCPPIFKGNLKKTIYKTTFREYQPNNIKQRLENINRITYKQTKICSKVTTNPKAIRIERAKILHLLCPFYFFIVGVT